MVIVLMFGIFFRFCVIVLNCCVMFLWLGICFLGMCSCSVSIFFGVLNFGLMFCSLWKLCSISLEVMRSMSMIVIWSIVMLLCSVCVLVICVLCRFVVSGCQCSSGVVLVSLVFSNVSVRMILRMCGFRFVLLRCGILVGVRWRRLWSVMMVRVMLLRLFVRLRRRIFLNIFQCMCREFVLIVVCMFIFLCCLEVCMRSKLVMLVQVMRSMRLMLLSKIQRMFVVLFMR